MIDTVLANRYRIQAKIGDGGMAVVYRALDLLLHRPVAIKCLRPQFASDPEFLQRFMQEAQAAASLSHPNVVNIFDVGHAGDVHYIVLEYVQGRNLKEILREEGRLPPKRAAHIARSVARALEAAHRRQLIHRDIKPHNILITPEGRVKVTDFGIARAASAATLTQTGTVIGSVHYFSPEQARGGPVGPASDLYALGVVLYEMLTGTVPFRGDSPIAVALKHLEEEPVPPSGLVPSIPAWLERVVLKALAKDPAQRYASAEEMAQDLAWRDTAPPPPLPAGEEDDWLAAPAEPADVRAASEEATRRVAAVGARALPGHGRRELAPPARSPRARAPNEANGGNGAGGDQEDSEDAAGAAGTRAGQRGGGRRGLMFALLFFVLLGAAGYAGTPYLLSLIFPPEVTVPDVVGLTYAEARELMAQNGLILVIEAERHDRNVPAGHIIRQSPEGGRTVRAGRTVHVTLSRGPELGVVPDVTGRPLREARLMLTQEGYVLGEEITAFEPGAPLNTVVGQEPAPGAEVEKGTPVNLWVNRPQEEAATVVVPDLRGRTLADAEAELEKLGLLLGNAWPEVNPLIPAGRIIDQNPPPASSVEQGTAVDVVYSGAPASDAPNGQEAQAGSSGEPADGQEVAPPHVGQAPAGAVVGEGDVTAAEGEDWESALRAADRKRRTARVDIYVPPGPPQEVVILVIDDFGAREVYREALPGGTHVRHFVEGRGDDARLQVYIGGMMEVDQPFPR
ncbi:MAG TPA: Stk1 family PASTA domain-containing Ser/Thr kinase [Limnochordales bacterium]